MPDDYNFKFGRNRNLRGQGWRGVVALFIVVAGGVVTIIMASPFASRLAHWVGY